MPAWFYLVRPAMNAGRHGFIPWRKKLFLNYASRFDNCFHFIGAETIDHLPPVRHVADNNVRLFAGFKTADLGASPQGAGRVQGGRIDCLSGA